VQRVERLFSESAIVTLASSITDEGLDVPTDAERALVARAIDNRKRDFATGRRLARAALAELGHGDTEILNGPDRAPIWPEGVRGSITHCDRCAVVAVTRADVGTVGVDVEHRDELKRDLWKTVFLPREIETLDAAFGAGDRGRMALVLFSGKESPTQAQYPGTGTFMGFHELHVAIVPDSSDASAGSLVCTFQNDVGALDAGGFARAEIARGRYRLDALPGGQVVTSVFIPRGSR